MKLNELTLKRALERLKKKEISLTELYIDISEAVVTNKQKYNIYLSLDAEAKEKADAVQDKALRGVPIGVKDNFLTIGIPTTASSTVLEGFMSPYESTVTQKLKEAGGVVLGKTNMDAWAHGSSTETSQYGRTLNPRNSEYLPGGSSGGSAAAIAADLCIGAIGSETAGSIRQPAAWCGCVGFKPTYGRASRYGVVAMGSSLDSPGPLGKTVEDTAILFEAISGHDPKDATSGNRAVPTLTSSMKSGVKGMRIGVCYIDHPKIAGTVTAEAVEEAGRVFERLGAHVEPVLLSEQLADDKILNPDYAIGLYTVIQRSEVSSNLARYDGIRYGRDRSYFGDEAKRRIMLGTFTLSAGYADKYFLKALKVRTLYIKNYAQLFEKFDVLISPTSPGFAQKVGATKDNPMFGELEDMLLEGSSVSGLPGINVPMYHDSRTNLYLGLNIVADQWQEERVVKAAYAFEQNTKWNPWVNQMKNYV